MGTSINLLGNNRQCDEELDDFRQLVHHLRHKNVDHRHGYEGLDDRFHGAPQNLCLRASHLRQRWRPTPPSSSSKTSKNSASLPLAVFWPLGALYCTCSTNSSFNGTERHAEWWSFSARAIATLICSCRSNERRRRSLLRLVEPEVTRSAFIMMSTAEV